MKEYLWILWLGMGGFAALSCLGTGHRSGLWIAPGALLALGAERLGMGVREQILLCGGYFVCLWAVWMLKKGKKGGHHNKFTK